MNRSYFPSDKSAQADWYANMTANFPGVAATLNFTTPERAAWLADCAYATFVLRELTGPVATFSQAVTGFANSMLGGPSDGPVQNLPAAPVWPPADMPDAVPAGIDGRRQKTVDRIKSSAGYTDSIGKLLHIVNPGDPFDPGTYVAEIRSAKENVGGQAVIAFSKAGGEIDGVNLYVQRAGDPAPVKVGLFIHTPAVDKTPLKVAGTPEQRTYTIVAVIDDEEIGGRSQAVSLLIS